MTVYTYQLGKKKIEWASHSINPITGCNGPNGVRCPFCYAQRTAWRFKDMPSHDLPKPDPFAPAWHPHRLDQITGRKKPTVWFFGSMCDWLDDGVNRWWIKKCLEVMKECPQHIFITLTKQYKNLPRIKANSPDGKIPNNVWVGISVTHAGQVWGMKHLADVETKIRFISFEPMLEDLSHVTIGWLDWMIVGGQSFQPGFGPLGTVHKRVPNRAWVRRMLARAWIDEVPVFVKPNAEYPEDVEEMPWERYLGEDAPRVPISADS